ncbi:MAG: aldehyde dehydrogenase family protein [Actinobacteria bacterium]|nr:aldehyde dehydrogenase family protein [Actinomycetota bacterium]
MTTAALDTAGVLVAGEAREGRGEEQTIFEPATGVEVTALRLASTADVDDAVRAAAAALAGRWGRTSAPQRSRLLHGLADAIEADAEKLVEIETRNVGKAVTAVRGEVGAAAAVLRYYASVAGSIEGSANPIGGSLTAYTLRESVGVCGQIVPWNYPLSMAVAKVAPALAAGCSVVLKPDALTPLSALRLGRLALEAGIPPGALNVVPGDGPTIGGHLVAHPEVRKVSFTGSTATGAEVMKAGAPLVKRLTLELGGKSPSLVFADADLGEAVKGCVWSVYSAAGQSCEARSRVLVEREIHDEFLTRFVERAALLRVGDPLAEDTQIGSLISTRHRDRVHELVEAARDQGAQVHCGGEVPSGDGAFYPPTTISDPDHGLAIEQAEVFGPVATVVPFDGEDEAVRLANDVRYGLMATVWTGDPARGPRLARRIESGTIGVNMPYTSFPGVPFGGFKQSGFGREFALETLDDYLETKSVVLWTGKKSPTPID